MAAACFWFTNCKTLLTHQIVQFDFWTWRNSSVFFFFFRIQSSYAALQRINQDLEDKIHRAVRIPCFCTYCITSDKVIFHCCYRNATCSISSTEKDLKTFHIIVNLLKSLDEFAAFFPPVLRLLSQRKQVKKLSLSCSGLVTLTNTPTASPRVSALLFIQL